MINQYISIDIIGGLGNQLFQIAAILVYNKYLVEKKQIVFKYEENLANNCNLPRKTFWNSLLKNQFLVLSDSEYKNIKFVCVHEINHFIYDIKPFPYFPHNILFLGYFQSFEYIDDDIRQQMIDLLYSNTQLVSETKALYHKIKNILNTEDDDDIVSIHIRRTDYVIYSNYHNNITLDYYKEALQIAKKKHVVVFSDDIEWCKENINSCLYQFENIYFVDTKCVETDFLLMSMIKHNIIANSTFSLWASFVSKYSEKIIIAPKQWCGPDGDKNWSNIYHKYITNIL